MIKANELRIGNLVEYNDDAVIFQVTEVSKTGIGVKNANEGTWIELDQFSPIPLTPEILESAGFEKSEDDLGDFEFCFEDSLGNRIDKENGFYKYWYGERYAGYVELKYLHQLQNTYPVFNDWKELTINLHATV